MSVHQIHNLQATIGTSETTVGTIVVWGYDSFAGNVVNLDATESVQIGFEVSHDDSTYANLESAHPDVIGPSSQESFKVNINGHRYLRVRARATAADTEIILSVVRGTPWR